jgi:glycosyltransferase involved in cell wall biosynthesis
VDEGNTCVVVTVGSERQDRLVNGVRVVTVPGSFRIGDVLSFPKLGTARYLRRLIKDEEIDCVSVHTRFFPMTWIGVEAARKQKCPSVLTEHGSDFVRGVTGLTGLLSRLVDVTLGRRALRRATIRLAISVPAQRFVRRLSGKDSGVFHNAIFTSRWIPSSYEAHNRLVFIGRIVPGKGWAEAVAAFNVIAQSNQSLHLEIFGSGPDAGKLAKKVDASPYSGRISIMGAQPPSVLAERLSGAVLLNPTKLAEGFQTVLIEALVSGAKIVTFETPGINEMRESGARLWLACDMHSLVEAAELALSSPVAKPDPKDVSEWDWTTRSRQFVSIAMGALRTR